MLLLLVVLFLFWAVLAAALTTWSVWIQGYLYTAPAEGLIWRGPAAAGVITFLVVVWAAFDFGSVRRPDDQGRYRPLFEFSSSEDAKPFEELRVPHGSGEDLYHLRPGSGTPQYRLNGLSSGRVLSGRPDRIVVIEDGQRHVFELERDQKGQVKQYPPPWYSLRRQADPLRYRDDKGRVMTEDRLGVVTSFQFGTFFGNLVLNFLLLGACFAGIWTLLRFHWGVALLQAVVLWVALQLVVLPPILTRAEQAARDRAVQRPSG